MKLRIAFAIISCALSITLGLIISKGQLQPLSGKPDQLKAEREKTAQLSAELKSLREAASPESTKLAADAAKRADVPVAPTPMVKGKVRIGLSLDTLKEERWQRDRDTFVAKAQALGAEVIVLSANSDDVQQIKDCNSLLAQKIDVLVIAPHNGEAMARAVEEAHSTGVVVCAYDRLIRDCALDYYFTFDNVKVGELQGRFLMERLFPGGVLVGGAKKRIARIYGAPTDNNAKLFRLGQNNALQPYADSGQLEIVHEDWAEDWRPENGKKITQAAITRAGAMPLDAILASNDGTAGGAIQALLEEKLAGQILVTGQDADLEACRRILRGEQTMTVYKPLRLLAEQAAENAVALAQKKPITTGGVTANGNRDVPTVQVDIVAVHKDNIRETVVKDGFHKEADLFGAK